MDNGMMANWSKKIGGHEKVEILGSIGGQRDILQCSSSLQDQAEGALKGDNARIRTEAKKMRKAFEIVKGERKKGGMGDWGGGQRTPSLGFCMRLDFKAIPKKKKIITLAHQQQNQYHFQFFYFLFLFLF